MKQIENVYGWGLWLNTFKQFVDYQSIEILQYYLKTMLHASLKWRKDTSKTAEPNTYSKFFSFNQEVEKDKEINIQYIRSSDNATDLFTKALLTTNSESLFMISRCIICEIYEEELSMLT